MQHAWLMVLMHSCTSAWRPWRLSCQGGAKLELDAAQDAARQAAAQHAECIAEAQQVHSMPTVCSTWKALSEFALPSQPS